MCINSDAGKKEVIVSYNTKSEGSKLNAENIVSMFCGELPKGISFNVFCKDDVAEIHYYSQSLDLLNKSLRDSAGDAISYVKEFCRFISESSGAYLFDSDQIFCDENNLYFIPSLFRIDNLPDRKQTILSFLNSIAGVSEECAEKIRPVCEYADHSSVSVEDVLKFIEDFDSEKFSENASQSEKSFETVRRCPNCGAEYVDKYVFCMKCGGKLEEFEKETVIETAVQTVNETDGVLTAEPEEDKIPEEKDETEIHSSEQEAESNSLNNDRTESIEDFNPDKTGFKKVIKVKGLKHGSEDTTEHKAEESVQVKKESEPPKKETVQPKKEESHPRGDDSVKVSPDAVKSQYGETTLLGFTNYGETAVLNGLSNSFDTPNLIRKSTGEKIYISKRIFMIGKSSEKADYAVNNGAVSRVHAEISVVGSEYYVTDKDSTNHTYVNNSVIEPNSPHRIYDGDEIMFANEIFTFHFQ